MSSLARMLAVLDLFTAAQPVWTAEDIIAKLGTSRPTGYRYVRELVAAGLLLRLTGGLYHLGPRIIELDYQIRATDPVLQAGQPIMKALADRTGCDVLLSNIYGEQVLNVHHEPGIEPLRIKFSRGVPLPLFRGSTSKAILAFLPRSRLKRIYDHHAGEIAQANLGRTWEEFRRSLAPIRRAGVAYSSGELDPPNVGNAAPVFGPDGEVLGSLTLVTLDKRWRLLDQKQVIGLLRDGAREITEAIARTSHPDAAVLKTAVGERRLRRVK
jgi:DNA-binding IclR family transcriptional regulator